MIRINNKAQAAVETLLIYGVTILIVMLAIGALIGFGVIDLGRLLPDNCEISSTFQCENYVVQGKKAQLELRNTLGKNIETFLVDIEGEGDNEGVWQCNPAAYGLLVNGMMSNVVELDCPGLKIPVGKKIQGIITITYKTVGSDINRTVTGKIRATVS